MPYKIFSKWKMYHNNEVFVIRKLHPEIHAARVYIYSLYGKHAVCVEITSLNPASFLKLSVVRKKIMTWKLWHRLLLEVKWIFHNNYVSVLQ